MVYNTTLPCENPSGRDSRWFRVRPDPAAGLQALAVAARPTPRSIGSSRHHVGGRQIGRHQIGRCRARSCATRVAHATWPARAARGEREDAMLDRPSLPISEIVQIAANSALARVSWDGGRGRAPLGYIKGMAVMFAVAQRKLALGDPAAVEMS